MKNSALAAGATLAAKSTLELAAGFDDAMAQVQVATGISDRQSEAYKRLEAAARDVGGSTKFSATEAADGLAALSQAGLNADDAIAALPAVAQAAAVNNVSLADAAKTVTVAMNAFGLSATDATKIIDVQTTAAAAGVLNFGDFQQAIAAVGAVANMSNQSLNGTTAELLALTNAGLSASDAGTSFKTALVSMIKPSSSGAAAIEELGLQVYDANGKMKPFSDIIAQVEKNTKGMSDEQKNNLLTTLAGTDGIRAFSLALGAHTTVMRDGKEVTLTGSAALKEWEKQLDNSSGSTSKAAEVLGGTFNAQLEKLTGNIQDAAIGIGQKLLPQLSGIVQGASKIIDKIQGFEESTHILSTMTSIGFKPLELAINAVLFVMDKLGEAIKFAEPYAALLGATIETKVLPPLKTLADIARTPFDLIDQGLKKIDFGIASSSTDQLKAKIIELKGKTEDFSKSADHAKISAADIANDRAIKGLGDLANAAQSATTTSLNLGNAWKALGSGITTVSATPIDQGIIAMTRYGDVSGSTSGQIKLVNDELTRLKAAVSEASQEMNDASGKMSVLDNMATKMGGDVAAGWQEWKNYNDRVAEGGANADMWSTKAEQVKSKLIALNPKMADVTAAYEIQNEKLKTSTSAYEDNTISMALNEGKATDLSAKLKGETTQAFSGVAKAALGVIPSFDSLNKQISTTPGVTVTAMSKTKSAVAGQNFSAAAAAVGASIVDGITAGILAGAGRVAAQAVTTVANALAQARDAIGAHSPSEVFKEDVGKPISEGLALGILGNAKTVLDAMNKVMLGVTSEALEAASKQADILAKVADTTGKIFDSLSALRGYVQIGDGPIEAFSKDTFALAANFYNATQNFTTKMLDATDRFSDTVGKVGSSAKSAFDALAPLKDYSAIGVDRIYAFGQDVFSLSAEFYNNSRFFTDKMLTASDSYSDTVAKVAPAASAAFDALSKLPGYSAVGANAIHAFGQDVDSLSIEFYNNSVGFDEKMLASAANYSDTVGKVSSAASSAFGALTSLQGYVRVGAGTIHEFGQDVDSLSIEFYNNSVGFDAKMLTSASNYADAASKMVGVVGAGVQNFTALQKYKRVAQENIDGFAQDLEELVTQTVASAANFDSKAITATAAWGEAIGKLTGGLKSGMDLFNGLLNYKKVASAAIRAFVDDIDLTIQLTAEMVKRTDSDLMKEVGNFGDATGKLFNGLKAAMDTFAGLEKFKSTPSNVIKQFIAEVIYTVGLAGEMARKTDVDLLAQAVDFYDATGKIFNNIKSALDAFKALQDYKGYPADTANALIGGIVDATGKMTTAVSKATEFRDKAVTFQNRLFEAGDAIKNGAEAAARAASDAAKAASSASANGSASVTAHALGGIHQGGPALVGEAGAELLKTPGGVVKLVIRPTYFQDLPRGTEIFNARETQQMVAMPASYSQIMTNNVTNNYYHTPNFNTTVQSMQSTGSIMSDFAIIAGLAG
jgi:TP901 family phage tail tape measure protein